MVERAGQLSHFHALFQATPQPHAAVAADPPHFTVLAINDAYERLADGPADALVGCGLFEGLPADVSEGDARRDQLRASLMRVVERGQAHTAPAFRYSGGDGQCVERWWSATNTPIFDESGEVRAILHSVDDLSEFHTLERAKRQREAAGQTDRRRVLVVEVDPQRREFLERLCCNQWQTIGAASVDEAMALALEHQPHLVLVSANLPRLGALRLVDEVHDTPQLSSTSVVIWAAHASARQREWAMASVADDVLWQPSGPREIVARIQAQLAASEVRKTIEEQSRNRYYDIFMQSPAFVVVMEGPEQVYTLSNPAHNALRGRDDIVGRTIDEVYPAAEFDQIHAILDHVYHTGEPFFGEESHLCLRDEATGEVDEHYVTFAYVPTYDLRGNIDGVAAMGWDVTELVEARQKLEEQARTLADESRKKDAFLAVLGHELRNPLAPLSVVAGILRRSGGALPPERIREVGEVLRRQITHLTRLVDDLLDMSRIRQGRVELQREPHRLREAVEIALDRLRPIVEERHQHLVVDLPDARVDVDADKCRIAQMLTNLLDNATKYTPEGGHIWLTARVDGDELLLRVVDDGQGIAATLLPHVFDVFEQADKSLDRASGGLGLGLTIVRQFAHLHGGEVTVHSDGIGEGTAVEVRLPIVLGVAPRSDAEPVEPVRPVAAAPERVEHGQPTHRGDCCRRVLVVDDNPDAATAMDMLVRMYGHQSRVAHDGPAALRAAADFAPDVVLLDIGLPHMDGYEVARRLRADPTTARATLVALTGYASAADEQEARQAGFDRHLVKPADPHTLMELLEEAPELPGSRP